jgi:hypothetical protein
MGKPIKISADDRTKYHRRIPVCLVDAHPQYPGEEEANAYLIAAAPETAAERDKLKDINKELLEALEEVIVYQNWEREYKEPHPIYFDAWDKAHKAIAKAKGES